MVGVECSTEFDCRRSCAACCCWKKSSDNLLVVGVSQGRVLILLLEGSTLSPAPGPIFDGRLVAIVVVVVVVVVGR
jgi:hypothetical protein